LHSPVYLLWQIPRIEAGARQKSAPKPVNLSGEKVPDADLPQKGPLFWEFAIRRIVKSWPGKRLKHGEKKVVEAARMATGAILNKAGRTISVPGSRLRILQSA
jgi:hypothetical protein